MCLWAAHCSGTPMPAPPIQYYQPALTVFLAPSQRPALSGCYSGYPHFAEVIHKIAPRAGSRSPGAGAPAIENRYSHPRNRYPATLVPVPSATKPTSGHPVDKLWIKCPCLCTACVSTCGKKKTFGPYVPLTCGNVRVPVWMKDSFEERSSTACTFTLGIPAGRRHRGGGKYTCFVICPTAGGPN
jgi:hypothetical protein